MHRYRRVAQISLILSILNLVLTSPILVQGTHEARGDEMVVAEDVAAMPKKRRKLEAASARSTSPPSSPDAMASPQHLSSPDGSTSSGYPSPYLSSDSSVSGYSWLLDRPPRLSPNRPASLYGSPQLSSSGSSEIAIPEWYHEIVPEIAPSSHLQALSQGLPSPHHSSSGSSEIVFPEWYHELAPEMPPSPPSPGQGQASSQASSPGSSEIPPSPQLTGSESDQAMTETYSPSDDSDLLTPSHHPSSLSTDSFSWHYRNPWFSDESMSTPTPYSSASGSSGSLHYLSASGGPVPSHASDSISMPSLESISGGSVPSHHSMPEEFAPSLTPGGSPPSPVSRPTETPPDNAEFFNKNMMKKVKIVAGVIIVGGAIAAIVGSQIKHRDFQDS